MKKTLGVIGCWGAAFVSYHTWHAFWWAVLHGFLGWIYLAYWIVNYSGWL